MTDMVMPEEWAAVVAKAAVDAYRRGRIDELITTADYVEHYPHSNVTMRRHQATLVVQLRRKIELLKGQT